MLPRSSSSSIIFSSQIIIIHILPISPLMAVSHDSNLFLYSPFPRPRKSAIKKKVKQNKNDPNEIPARLYKRVWPGYILTKEEKENKKFARSNAKFADK